jgi:ELWxxDGT repeat protein
MKPTKSTIFRSIAHAALLGVILTCFGSSKAQLPTTVNLVKDLADGESNSMIAALTATADAVFFFLRQPVDLWELWKSGGTEENTFPVDAPLFSFSHFPMIEMTAVGNSVYWLAREYEHGGEAGLALWKYDESEETAVKLKTFHGLDAVERGGRWLWLGEDFWGPNWLKAAGDVLYFTILQSSTGRELWRSDGTPEGTSLVRDIFPGLMADFGWSSSFQYGMSAFQENPQFVPIGDIIYFKAYHPTAYGIWRSDGTEGGTFPVHVLGSGDQLTIGVPHDLTAVGQSLFYFTCCAGSEGWNLWKLTGDAPVLVRAFTDSFAWTAAEHGNVSVMGGFLYFQVRHHPTDPSRRRTELWKTDGTITEMVKELGSHTQKTVMMVAGNSLYFTILNGEIHELWRSRGTEESTEVFKQLNAGDMTVVDKFLCFTAYEPMTGLELWKSDGTRSGTGLVADIWPGPDSSSPQMLTAVGDKLFFIASEPSSGRELWVAGGFETGETLVGQNVLVEPIDELSGDSPATLTFSEVTEAGITTLTVSEAGPEPPAGFIISGQEVYFDISTTAEFTGLVTVCIESVGLTADSELHHFEDGNWVNVTTYVGGGVICGAVTSFSPFLIVRPGVTVAIDIKPGSDPNSINLGSNGVVPVAIFSTPTFDARQVDPATVTLADAQVKVRGKGMPQASFQDINGDGWLDLVLQMETEGLNLTLGDTRAILRGKTFDGTRIRGVDSIRVVN